MEDYNFEMRKVLLDYDQVMDKQRKYIYGLRREILEGRDLTAHLHRMIENIIADITDVSAPQDKQPEEWDMEGLEAALHAMFGFEFELDGDDAEEPLPIAQDIFNQVLAEYARREAGFAEELRAHFSESDNEIYAAISPEKFARKRFHEIEASELCASSTRNDPPSLRHGLPCESVRLRAFGQKDPLLEYKQEGYELFESLIRAVEENTIQMLFRITDPSRRHRIQPGTARQAPSPQRDRTREYQSSGADTESDRSFSALNANPVNIPGAGAKAGGDGKKQPVRVVEKIKPNDPCPCGSGKKYKKCCGRLNE